MRKALLLLVSASMLIACQTIPQEQAQRALTSPMEQSYGTKEFTVKVNRYSAPERSKNVILILPPTGGSTYLDRKLSNRLYRAGFDVYLLEEWTGLDEKSDDLRLHDRLYTRSLQAIEEVLKAIPEDSFIGILGTSVGATYVAVAVSQIDRINAGFSIVGGAPIPGIIVNSDQKAMRDLRTRRYKKFQFNNDEEYLDALEQNFPLDPFKQDKTLKGKKLGMAIAKKDTTIPVHYQRELERLWKPSTVFEIDSSHFWAIVGTWWKYDKDIVQFFLDASK